MSRKKIGQNTGEEQQTLLSKRREKLQSKLSHARFNHIDWIPHWSVFRTKAHLSNGG